MTTTPQGFSRKNHSQENREIRAQLENKDSLGTYLYFMGPSLLFSEYISLVAGQIPPLRVKKCTLQLPLPIFEHPIRLKLVFRNPGTLIGQLGRRCFRAIGASLSLSVGKMHCPREKKKNRVHQFC